MAAEGRVRVRGDGERATLEALATGARALAASETLDEALSEITARAGAALGARVAVARVLDRDRGCLTARTVVSASPAIAAEVVGSRLALADLPEESADETDAPAPLRALAERAGAQALLILPVRAAGEAIGSLELFRTARPFSPSERLVAGIAADQVAAAVRAFGIEPPNGTAPAGGALELAGEALAAGSDDERTADEVARLAAEATGARAAVVWRRAGEDLHPIGAFRAADPELGDEARGLVAQALAGPGSVAAEPGEGVVTLQLGEPSLHALQLTFPDGAPAAATLAALGTFGARAAYALRAGERTRTVALELERTRELLALAAGLNAELTLAHRLETVLDRVADLLGPDSVAVYLLEDGRLTPAAVRELEGPHLAVAERLLELALGPARARGRLVVRATAVDPRLADLERELRETGIEAAVAVPLLVREEVTGLLAVYPRRGRTLGEHEAALIAPLAGQLAVALQNARLHERATRLGSELESVLELERSSARRLAALYEISRSFVHSMAVETAPLDATLGAVVRTVVELLDVDAGVIRMPDARRENLVPRALHVADERLAPALRALLAAPQPLEKLPGRRVLRQGKALVLDAEVAQNVGGAHQSLVPFLEKGGTAVVLPILSSGELLGTLKLLSLDARRPITDETVEIGLSVAAQAALAIDNARLYEHQKYFTEAMQRSLLPQTLPDLPGFRLGAIYAASSHVELGGDVYDYMLLPDGRLAVVLGDVTGHGVDAAADMAMAKFVFRSLARDHPEPAAFLSTANDVVFGEIGAGKFITLLYLTVDPAGGFLTCASAGHPAPRLVLPDGSVRPLAAGGLALGIEPGQAYEEVRTEIPPGASVVLYTDGVVEARRGGELYGTERLDALLAERSRLTPQDLAAAVIADCRGFAGGQLPDDCALVVIQRRAE